MSQVLDASVVFAALCADDDVGRWCDARLAAGDVVAPTLLPYEVMSVIRRHERRGTLDATAAGIAVDYLGLLHLTLVEFAPLAGRIWEIRHNISSYDASYVALAEALDAPLVTLDRRLSAAPGLDCEVIVAP